MEDPLKVWGGSALELIVEVDENVSDGYPFKVRVGLKNVADVPSTTLASSCSRRAATATSSSRASSASSSLQEIAPGETFWAGPFILVPDATGDIDLSRSYIKKTAGDVDLKSTIVTKVREPSIEDTPEDQLPRAPEAFVIDFEQIPDATAYEVFATPDRETDFPDTPLSSGPAQAGQAEGRRSGGPSTGTRSPPIDRAATRR